MKRPNWIGPVGAIVIVCTASVLTVFPSVAHGAVPGPGLGELQRTVGEAVSQAADLTKPPPAPVTPAPAPRPAAPAPAPRASTPAPAAATQAPPAPARQASGARASSSQKGDSPGTAAPERSSPQPVRASGAQAVEPADAPANAPGPAVVTAADLGNGDDEASLPFTGSNMLPLLLVAVLVLLTGIGLRRAVRTG